MKFKEKIKNKKLHYKHPVIIKMGALKTETLGGPDAYANDRMGMNMIGLS